MLDLQRDGPTTLTVKLPTEKLREVAARISLPNDVTSSVASEVINGVTDELAARSADGEEVESAASDDAVEEEAQAVSVEEEASQAAVATVEAADTKEPASESMAVPGQPDWVGQGDGRVAGNVFRMTGSVGPYSSHDECYAAQHELMRELTETYVTRYLGKTAAAEIDVPSSYLESKLLRGEWIGPVETSFGTMYEMHVLLEFDDASRRQFELWWHEARLQRRLWLTGTGAGLVLALLGTAFGYLKLDTATRGYYRGRLMIAAGTLALSATAAASVLAYLGLSVTP